MSRRAALSGTICTLLLATASIGPAAATPCANYDEYLHWTVGHELPAPAEAVALYHGFTQDYFVVANDFDGVKLFDLTDPWSPQLVGHADTWGTAEDVAISSFFAFVAAGPQGLVVVYIADPTAPAQIAQVALGGEATGIALAGGYAFVASGNAGMHVIDISSPFSPQLAGAWFPGGDILDIDIVGDLAYLCDPPGGNGLRIVDISSPTSPSLVGNIDVAGNETSVTVQDGLAYLTFVGTGLNFAIVDVSDPTAPTLLSRGETDNTPYGVVVSGSTALVASGNLDSFDVSDPAAPVTRSTHSILGEGRDIILVDDVIAMATTTGLEIFKAGPLETVATLGHIEPDGEVRMIAHKGQFAFVCGYGGGLIVVDYSDPAAPFMVGEFFKYQWITDIDLVGDIAFVVGLGIDLTIMDVTDPTAIPILDTLPLSGQLERVSAEPGTCYITTRDTEELHIVDVTDPSQAQLVSTTDLSYLIGLDGMECKDGYLYTVSQNEGLTVFDAHDPLAVIEVATRSEIQTAVDVTILGDKAYIPRLFKGVTIVDIAIPTSPQVLHNFLSVNRTEHVGVMGDLLCVGGIGSVQLFDVSQATAPRAIGALDRDIRGYHAVPTPGGILLGASLTGLYIAPIPCAVMTSVDPETSPIVLPGQLELSTYPNPFNPQTVLSFNMKEPGAVRVEIFDMAGRLVRRLVNDDFAAGAHTATWNGLDDGGRGVASGTYVARVLTRQGAASRKLALIR